MKAPRVLSVICHSSAVLALLAAAPLWSQATTAAATAGPDRSSPGAALTSLYKALRAGDLPAARACLHFKDPQQAELFDLSFSQVWMPLKLMHAMEARFGEAARKSFSNAGAIKSVDALLERVGRAEFRITGDAASVVDPKAAVNPSAESELTGVMLRREGGVWLVVASTFSDAASDMPEVQVKRLRPLGVAVQAACQETQARVERGEFKTAEEAYAFYQGRLRALTARKE